MTDTPTPEAASPETGASDATPKKRSLLVPILIVVAIVVIVGAGLVIYKKKNDDTTAAPPARKAAFGLFLAWKNANQAAAAKNANPASVQALFVLDSSNAQSLGFRGCKKVKGSDDKTCVWRRSNNRITMTVATVNGKPKVTAVKIEPDPATSASSTTSTTVATTPTG